MAVSKGITNLHITFRKFHFQHIFIIISNAGKHRAADKISKTNSWIMDIWFGISHKYVGWQKIHVEFYNFGLPPKRCLQILFLNSCIFD